MTNTKKTGPRVIISEEMKNAARKVIDGLSYQDKTLAAVAVLLAADGRMDQAEISLLLGISVRTLQRTLKSFPGKHMSLEGGRDGWGGDRRSLLTWEEEEEVLDSFTADVREGKVVTANDVHAALQGRTGRKVSLQTAYNVLYRHHWRKVAPDKAHPKNDPAKIEEFKKNVSGRGIHGFRQRGASGAPAADHVPGRGALRKASRPQGGMVPARRAPACQGGRAA